MATISFKADDELNARLDRLARRSGINKSAYIKLILTRGINGELTAITENGLTVAEELAILESDTTDGVHGPFTKAKAVLHALRKKKK